MTTPMAVSTSTSPQGTSKCARTESVTPRLLRLFISMPLASPKPPSNPTRPARAATTAASANTVRAICAREAPRACKVAISRARSISDMESVWKIT
jgi:hypothetical protein